MMLRSVIRVPIPCLFPLPISDKITPLSLNQHSFPSSREESEMESIWRAATGQDPSPDDYSGIEFWLNPERSGWLTKQGDYIKTWRRRWFVLKQGKLLWFKDSHVTPSSSPRGVIPVATCLTVKGAEDVVHKPCAFELATTGQDTMYFIADSEKEKEDWINSIGRSIVQHSRSLADDEVLDYNTPR